jgi:WhiB family transcriptional regulator, redox-sensing transcriptional regulator
VTVVVVAGTHREAILAHLADYPDLTASELTRVIGASSARRLTDLLRNMEAKAQVISRPGRRPGQGRPVHLWRLAPPGTVPQPRPPVPVEVLAHKRQRDRRATAARRARARPLFAGTAALPDAACLGADPALFFPGQGDAETEAAAVAICSACPARASCLASALQNDERYGIWGGINLETWPRRQASVTG